MLLKKITVILFLVFLSSGFLGILIGVDEKSFAIREQRDVTTLSFNIPTTRKEFRTFTKAIENYIADFAFARPQYIQLYRALGLEPSPVFTDTQSFQGLNGFYFLGNNYRKVLDYTRNAKPYTQDYFDNQWQHFSSVIAECEKRNIPVVVVIAPNKHSVYPEYLPGWVKIKSEYRLANALADKAKEENLPLIFPIEEILAAKQDIQVYFKDDSHWNNGGSYIALQAVWAELYKQIPSLPEKLPISIEKIERPDTIGDLRTIAQIPVEKYDLLEYKFIPEFTKETSPFKDKNLFRIGDSFGEPWAPLFSEMFKSVSYEHVLQLDPDFASVLDKHNPDIVIYEVVERNLL